MAGVWPEAIVFDVITLRESEVGLLILTNEVYPILRDITIRKVRISSAERDALGYNAMSLKGQCTVIFAKSDIGRQRFYRLRF